MKTFDGPCFTNSTQAVVLGQRLFGFLYSFSAIFFIKGSVEDFIENVLHKLPMSANLKLNCRLTV